LLNQSYVYSCTANFQQTLSSIVKGLNGAGFSEKDYRAAELPSQQPIPTPQKPENGQTTIIFEPTPKPEVTPKEEPTESTTTDDINTIEITTKTEQGGENPQTQQQIQQAEKAAQIAQEQQKTEILENPEGNDPTVYKKRQENMVGIQEKHRKTAAGIKIPQFFIETEDNPLFESDEWRLLEIPDLYKDFNLATQDKNIDLANVGNSNIIAYDITDENEYVLKKVTVSSAIQNAVMEQYAMYSREARLEQFSKSVARNIHINDIPEPRIKNYVHDVLKELSDENLQLCIENPSNVTYALTKKIKSLLSKHAQTQFDNMLLTKKIKAIPSFTFNEHLVIEKRETSLQHTLYSAENGNMNQFEHSIAAQLSTMSNIVFWHRNLERGKGFYINGFINHYPDFIVYTEKGNIILVETKGEQLANDDSKAKLVMGNKWADKAGDEYYYFMVFENYEIEGAKNKADFFALLKEL
ncbi:MAG: hypothetical protein HUK15_07925, partial [Bacteroidales bacterium]|nr:hypothetical protein [Bacteroidales bacterium]